MDNSERARIAEIALWVAILSIAGSASAITWSLSRTKQMTVKVSHLEDQVDVLDIRYTNLLAYLQARGIHIPEEYEE